MPFRRRTLAWLLLAAYVLTSAIWAKGLVLCFEADGHVSIESATSDCSDCCATGDANGSSPEDPCESLSACACLDVALSVGNVSVAKKSTGPELQRAALAASVPVRWTAPAVVELRPVRWLPRSHASAALPFLNSVVLRV